MVQRYFAEPYRFVPPYKGTFWCRLGRGILPCYLRRKVRVCRWRFEGLEYLKRSLADRAGIVLAPNHCRASDVLVVGQLGLEIRQFFYYLASYHLFKQSRFSGWQFNRLGAFSILREAADRQALRASSEILASAERPLMIFPEGTWVRRNDRLGPLQDGLAFIARHAARHTERELVVHPVAIKFWLLEDPRPALDRRLAALETRLGWNPQSSLQPVPRLEKLGEGLLAVKEVEQFGHSRTGPLDPRIRELAEALVDGVEMRYGSQPGQGLLLERIRALRQRLSRRMAEAAGNGPDFLAAQQAMYELLFCENLSANSVEYLRERPSFERMEETLQRIEETLTDDVEIPLAPLGVVAEVAPAINVRDFPREKRAAADDGDPLLQQLGGTLQAMLDRLLQQGPPPEWNCPPPVEGIGPAD